MTQIDGHDLLIGRLAVRNSLLNEQLDTVINQWESSSDRKESFSEFLVESGKLSPAVLNSLRQLAGALAEKWDSQLTMGPAGSTQKHDSLFDAYAKNSESAGDENRGGNNGGAENGEGLSSPNGNSSGNSKSRASNGTVERTLGRFEVKASHARGGLGEVFVARDKELNRDVALKQMHERFADDSHLQKRFRLEAELTGRLEHPGIVPVYGLGVDQDDHPYYAMRFIRGESLKTAIRNFHDASTSTGKPIAVAAQPEDQGIDQPIVQPNDQTAGQKSSANDTRSLVFRKLLNHFVSVCYTMHFAHSRGVIHRDLKPDNIMLGAFGETLVVDWGIAKVISDPDSETGLDVSMTSARGATRIGSVIGTPAFMSPEQGLGWHDSLTARSDVFSLGVILFQLLTGRLPVEGCTSTEQILQKMIGGDYGGPRDFNPKVPKALDAICRKAMSCNSKNRYGSTQALAEDLEAHLADLPVRARRESWLEQLARYSRRYRSAFVIAGFSLLGISVIATAAAFLINGQKNIAQTERDRATLLAEEKARLATAESVARENESVARQQAEKETIRAEAATERAEGVLDFLVNIFKRPDPEQDGRTVTIAEVLDQALAEIDQILPDDPQGKAELLQAIADTYDNLGVFDSALKAIGPAIEILTVELGADDPETLAAVEKLGNTLAANGESLKAISIFEELVEHHRDSEPRHENLYMSAITNLGAAYLERGLVDKAIPVALESSKLLEAAYGKDDLRTIAALNNLAYAYMMAGRFDEAIPMHRELQAAMVSQLGKDHPDTLMSLNNLGLSYVYSGQSEKSIPIFEEVLELRRKKLGPDHPHTLRTEQAVAVGYWKVGRTEEALPLYESSLKGLSEALGDDHPDVITMRANMALALSSANRLDDAIELATTAIEGLQQKFEPGNSFRRQMILELGHMQLRNKDFEAAIKSANDFLREQRRFDSDDESAEADGRTLRGAGQLESGDFESARKSLAPVVEKFTSGILKTNSTSAALARADAETLLILAFQELGEIEEAKELYQQRNTPLEKIEEDLISIQPTMRYRIERIAKRLKEMKNLQSEEH